MKNEKTLYIQKNNKGRGVYAGVQFNAGDTIEVAPVILVDNWELIDQTNLTNYYFDWYDGNVAIGLGYVSLYNHSYEPNAKYFKLNDTNEIEIEAYKTILKGEEITVNYNNGDPECQDELWFETI